MNDTNCFMMSQQLLKVVTSFLRYLERSWRRWRSQRWCRIAAKGRPSWTRKLSQPEMRFLEYVCSPQSISVIWFKSLILPWPATPWWCLPQPGGLPLPLLPLIHSKDDLLMQSAANLFPAKHSSFVQESQRKTTFQCRLWIAAQETEPTRERDEFKSKFTIQALSNATCPSDNTYFEVIQSFSK